MSHTHLRKKGKARILIIDDDREQADEIRKQLDLLGYETLWAHDGVNGLKLVNTESPDIVVLETALPDINAHEVCRWIKMQGRGVPVIMLTVKGEGGERVMGLHTGADDYLPKPFSWEELNARLYACLRTRNIQEELRSKNQQLEELLFQVEKMAITDALSGLFNRRRFQEILQKEYHRAQRYSIPLSCLMIDLDHFKALNDTHGHEAGDAVLSEMGKLLLKTFRDIDTVARFGGEEFTVILPETDRGGAAQAADRLLTAVSTHPFTGKPTALHMTVSVGISGLPDEAITSPDQLIQAADFALYVAKQAGRNRIEICDSLAQYMKSAAPRGADRP
ncbi:MAG TPA: diguanylate cyclase [Nitrospiria bacterium]|nr:diguanylate cyclase [Nitrospiria bacterium]